MPITLQNILTFTVPTLAALLGFLWFRRKKKDLSIEDRKENFTTIEMNKVSKPDDPAIPLVNESSDADSVISKQKSLTDEENKDDALTKEEAEPVLNDISQPSSEINAELGVKIDDEAIISVVSADSNVNCTESIQKEVAEDSIVPEESLVANASIDVFMDQNSGPVSALVPQLSKCKHEKKTDSAPLLGQACAECDEVLNDASGVSSDQMPSSSSVACSSSGDESSLRPSDTSGTGSSSPSPSVILAADKVGEKSEDSTNDALKKMEDILNSNVKQNEVSVKENEVVDGFEEKLTLKIDNDEVKDTETESETKAQVSPLSHPDTVNGSCPSSNCDAHSEVSIDSGQGNSVETSSPIAQSPSPNSPAPHSPNTQSSPETESPTLPEDEYTVHCFYFPTQLCGRLIGRNGKQINIIKNKSGAEISVSEDPYGGYNKELQVVTVEGTRSQVNSALEQIKRRFSPRHYPGISFEHISPKPTEGPILAPEIMQLSLPQGIFLDVLVSSVVDCNHVFLQQPTHPTFPSLERLNHCMNTCYGQEDLVPQLPRPIEVGVICAAPMFNGWYRAQVVNSFPETDECDIKFVDYGGYLRVQGSAIRQIRSDFTTLPFQAVECYLANVAPLKGETGFSPTAVALLEELVHGRLVQCQVCGVEEDGVPYVELYFVQGDKNVLLNRDLVMRGVAQWLEA